MRKFVAVLIIAAGTTAGWAAFAPRLGRLSAQEERNMDEKAEKSDRDWKATLTREQYDVLRMCGTEPPFSGKFNDFWQEGTYVCVGCGTPLFSSKAKYDHGTGWPSFFQPIDVSRLELRTDHSFLTERTEVRCAVCGGHLGHVFKDGPAPTGLHYCINSAALDFRPARPETAAQAGEPAVGTAGPKTEIATFAAGCFWGVQAKFRKVPGVVETQVGYTGGRTAHPTYAEVCTDRTGHAEAVEVRFDPDRVSYRELLDVFFSIHDPTQLNRQGPDRGTQYRSAVFTHSEEQRRVAEQAVADWGASGRFSKPIVTQVVPAGPFTRAEEYHQDYYEKHGGACRL
jgi:peptide methionine sulfoxide reductase msrA/msrB